MAKKNSGQTFLYFLFLVLVIFIPEQARALCPIDPSGTYIEAENFSGSYNLDGTPNAGDWFSTAAEGSGTVLVSGSGGSATTTPGKEVKTYQVTFSTTGTYYIWMRGKALSGSQDSMFFTVDNDAWKAWNFGSTYNTYIWTKSMQVGTDNTIQINTAGTHTLKIAMREADTSIDGFYLTKGSETPANPPTGNSVDPQTGCPGPYWTANPDSLGPTCFKGYNAAAQTFTITNTGNNDDPATATITIDETWAVAADSVVPALAQNDSHTVTVNFNTSALSAGTYTATLTITGAANNSPLKVPITLIVKSVPSTAACGEIPLYAENLINPAIMVQLDTSGSMNDKMDIGGGVEMSRIAIAEDVLKEVFLDRSIAWGFATWAGGSCNDSDSDNSPTYYTKYRIGIHEHDAAHQAALQDKADDGYPSGCTPLAPTMRAGLEYFKSNRLDSYYTETYFKYSCQPRILVIVTDGLGNTATDNTRIDKAVEDLITEGVSIVAVGFGLTNADQLDRIVKKMQTAGEADDEDQLYHLHNEDATGTAVPFMAQNRQEFIDAMNSIVSNVKAQVFHGSSPAPTTSVDNGAILLNASFDASDWTGNITGTRFNTFTGELEATYLWETKTSMPAVINGFIYDSTATTTGYVSAYTDASIAGDNFLCKAMGDVINSTPAIIGSPPYYYKFDSYFAFKYDENVRARDELAYVGSNDGALHVFKLSDGSEKWRFYPDSVKTEMALAGTNPSDDMCSPSYCHKFLVDGSPEPMDIYVDSTGWRTVLTTGLGQGGSAFFALDVTYGEDFDAPAKTLSGGTTLEVKSKFLWEFTDTDLGLATSWPSIDRVYSDPKGTGWATYFGSGYRSSDDPLLQSDKESYLFAVNSWDKSQVWLDASDTPIYKIKLHPTTLKNDVPGPPLVIDTQDDDYLSDRIYMGNLYGNMYRVKEIGFNQKPVSELFYDAGTTDHTTPVTAKAGYAYAGHGDIWLYFGTGKYIDQVDKLTVDQQYFLGLFDEGAATATAYKKSDLVEMKTSIIEAYALNADGTLADLDGDGNADLNKYRTLSCTSPDIHGVCNADNKSWILNLAIPADSGSERVISQPLVVGGVVFFTTFVPDGDVCEGNGDTWLFALDWENGNAVSPEVFDINGNDEFDSGDTQVRTESGDTASVAGIYIGTGKPSGELVIYNDILYVGTTDQPPTPVNVNLPDQRTRLRSWQQIFK
ncbi:PilC/PilY family type IV pilus protein [Desulfospira joergensenii]|uniref:PilC/PilY family type IV pilus protein n=1 Tax=Desulfospira joergensenii TaxID=53329 RepID=UPI0003B778A6|nr:PilC/PilY family type IV pilus protein [Desulfospira joergensenii]